MNDRTMMYFEVQQCIYSSGDIFPIKRGPAGVDCSTFTTSIRGTRDRA